MRTLYSARCITNSERRADSGAKLEAETLAIDSVVPEPLKGEIKVKEKERAKREVYLLRNVSERANLLLRVLATHEVRTENHFDATIAVPSNVCFVNVQRERKDHNRVLAMA